MLEILRKWLAPRRREVRAAVQARFRQIALAPGRDRRPIGPSVAKALGYDPAEIDGLPGPVTESFAGVGNPLSLGELRPGETVLDLGSGAGLDSILAAHRVGPGGRVVGIDFTPEMVQKARRNVQTLGLVNVEFRAAPVEALPLEGGTADVALCNGLFNLCPDKARALGEVFRVLRPGGRFLMAEVLLEDHVTPEEVARRGAWAE
jgi:SAM-dependent methyltransferase